MKKKIRILRIMHRINIGGPTHHAGYLTKFINDDKFETLLISGKINDDELSGQYILDNMGVDVYYLNNMYRKINIINDIKSYFEIKKIIKEFKPDIVHTHAAKSGALGRLAAINQNVPYIFHTFHGHVFHSYFSSLKTFFYKLIERYLAKKSTKIIAISKQQKYELSTIHKICNKEHLSIINLGFDLDKFNLDKEIKRSYFRKEFKLEKDEFAIGIIGRLTSIKNQKMFIEVIKKVITKSKKKIRAFIVGDGEDLGMLKLHAKKINISNKNLEFTSWRKDMDYVYNGLDIVCLTSLNEGTPVTLIEAQASSKPVVSTNVGGVVDVIVDKKSGFIVEKNNVNNFVQKILTLVDNKELRNKFSKFGYNFVTSKFSYKRLVFDIKKLYETNIIDE